MENIYGNKPVSGSNFYGREKVIKLLAGILTSGNSFLLLGLRRTGKSSTIAEALRVISESNPEIEIIRLNCQTYKSLQDFYQQLNLALPTTWQKKLRNALKESKKIPTKLIDFISDHIEELDLPYIGSVKLRNDMISYANPIKEEVTKFFKEQDKKIILFIDELPFLFENINKSDNSAKLLEIESVLTTLRDWREIGISQAICGSLNLHLQLQQMGVSKKLLAGLNTQQLPLFTQKEAAGLLSELSVSKGFELSEEQIDEMVNIMPDTIPQFLQYYFFVVNTYFTESENTLSDIYEEYVRPNIITDFEYQFEERLSQFTPENRVIVTQILNLLKAGDKITQSKILSEVADENGYGILLKLMDFEFIQMNPNQECSFTLQLLRNWWITKNL